MSNFSPTIALHLGLKTPKDDFVCDSEEYRMDKSVIQMEKISNGDENALVELINEWKGSIYAFFFRSLSNHADSEDLTQKFFHRIYRAAGTYKPKAKVSTWLFTIARNLLIDELKRRARRPQESMLVEWETGSSVESSENEIEEILSREMSKLGENQRTALLLRVQQEWSYREIADMMKTNEANVKTWIFRARSILKKAIKPQL